MHRVETVGGAQTVDLACGLCSFFHIEGDDKKVKGKILHTPLTLESEDGELLCVFLEQICIE